MLYKFRILPVICILINVAISFSFYPVYAEITGNNKRVKRIMILPYQGGSGSGEYYIRNILPDRMNLFFNQTEGVLSVSSLKLLLESGTPELSIPESLFKSPDESVIKKFREEHIDFVLSGYLKNDGVSFYLLDVNAGQSEAFNIVAKEKFSFTVFEKLIPLIAERTGIRNDNQKSVIEMVRYKSVSAFLKYMEASASLSGEGAKKAMLSLKDSLKIDPDDLSAKTLLAQIFTIKEEKDRAELLFDEVLRLNPGFTPAVTGKGIMLMAKGDNDKAARFLEDRLKILPGNIPLMFNCGIANERAGNSDRAEDYYQKIIEKDPHNFAAIYNLASLYFKNRHYQKSVPLFRKLAEDNPEDVIFSYNIASAYLHMGATESARKKLLEIAQKGSYKEVFNDLGIIYRREKRFDEGEKYFLKALELDSTYSPAYNNLGILFMLTGDLEKAEKNLHKAVQYNIRDTDALYNLGILYLRRKEYDQAWLFFSRAYDISPGFVNAGINLAISEMYRGNVKEAEEILHRLLKKFPDNAMALYNMGVLSKNTGDNKKALEYFEKTVKVEPEFVDALNNMGVIYIGENKWEQAVSALDRALNISPDNSVYLFNRGLASYYPGKYDEAEVFFGRAIAVNPEFHNAGLFLIRSNLLNGKYQDAKENLDMLMQGGAADYQTVYLKAVWFERTGQTLKAAETLEKLLEQYNDFLEGYQKLGLLYISLQRYGKAEEIYNRLTAIDPGDYESWINLGNVYSLQKKNDLAEKAFNEAVKGATDNPSVYHHRGMFFVNTGDFSKAAADYETAVKLEPKNTDYLSNLALSLTMINRFKEGEDYINKALKIRQGDPLLLYRKAFIYAKMKNREKLLQTLRQAVEKDPSIKTRLHEDEDFREYWDDRDFKALTIKPSP